MVILEGRGGLELVINNLPNGILPNSLFAEVPKGIEVQTLRYREREILPEDMDNSSALAQLAPQIREVNQKVEVNAQMQSIVAKQLDY